MIDTSKANRVPTAPNVVNYNYQRNLRSTKDGLFKDAQPSRKQLMDKSTRQWWVYGFSGKIGVLHHTQRQKFLTEVQL